MDYEIKSNLNYDAEFSTQDYLSKDIVLAEENYLASSADVGSNYAQEVLTLVNEERAKVGASPVSLSSVLMNFAAVRANEIETYFSHTRPDGTYYYSIIDDTYSSTYVGENIGAGVSSAEEVMELWMNSTGHRANILRKSHTELGVGFHYDSNSEYKYYWVQHFANPLLMPKNSDEGISYIGFSMDQVTLKVGSKVTAEIWADIYTDDGGIEAVDARDNPNDLILAGTYSNSNTIYGGSGNSSLWGGYNNIDDTLVGGSGSEMFWYGKYEGYDVISNADSSDIVNLYDVSLNDIAVADTFADQIVIRFNTGTALVIKDTENVTPAFQLGGGGRYKYNRDSGQWQSA